VSPAAVDAPRASRLESLRFNLAQTLPQFLEGPFRKRPRVQSWLARHHPDPQGVRAVRRLRRKHGSDYVWVSLIGKPTLLVLDPEGVRRVLDASPDVYGPPELKTRGMSHFQPGAVTLSTRPEWRRRRDFNEEVLASGSRVHPRAATLLATVAEEVDGLLERRRDRMTWSDLEGLFRRLAPAIVFGSDMLGSEEIVEDLERLMSESNRVFGLSPSPRLERFQERIREAACHGEAGGLAPAICPHVRPGDPLPVAGQVPHWLFALKDTVAANCAHALALILAHPGAAERVRHEVEGDLDDPAAVDAMGYLEGCLQDTMRLLPTTPVLLRVALRDDELGGRTVPRSAQVMIHNGYHHRNPDALDDPDRFQPERWEPGGWSYRFNHLSNGPQACAGRELVLLLGKAVLGRILAGGPWTLSAPRLDVTQGVPHALDRRRLLLERISGS
jgi:cytochrome P450